MAHITSTFTEPVVWKPARIRSSAATIADALRQAVRWMIPRKGPRVSLLTGCALVFLSLYLPIAYDACGPNRTGIEVLQGDGIWPGAMAFFSPWAEWIFYAFALAFAVFTSALLFFSFVRPRVLQNRILTKWTFALAGMLSLYLIADLFWVYLGFEAGNHAFSPLGLKDEAPIAVAACVSLLVLLPLFRSKFARVERWSAYLFGIMGVASVLVVADYFAEQYLSGRLLSDDTVIRMLAAPSALCWLIPALLWFRLGLSRRREKRALWPGIRNRISQLYFPLAVLDGVFLAVAASDGLWGFLAFFAGIQLLALGYLELNRRAAASAPTA